MGKYERGDVGVWIRLGERWNEIRINYGRERGGDSKNGGKEVNIRSGWVRKIMIEGWECRVRLKGECYRGVEGSRGDNRVIVGKDVRVGDLRVKKGNVEIYGRVKNMKFREKGGYVSV